MSFIKYEGEPRIENVACIYASGVNADPRLKPGYRVGATYYIATINGNDCEFCLYYDYEKGSVIEHTAYMFRDSEIPTVVGLVMGKSIESDNQFIYIKKGLEEKQKNYIAKRPPEGERDLTTAKFFTENKAEAIAIQYLWMMKEEWGFQDQIPERVVKAVAEYIIEQNPAVKEYEPYQA